MARTGWGQRIVQFCLWKPGTYGQVWLFAVLGFGVPGFIIWSVVGNGPGWPYTAFTCAASITFFGGLGQSWQLNRRRQRGL
ncbi:MAG TPA: hypothetical protein VNW50_02650 [Streptosporangiaceae bacterium]|nr:hypothetical protein [Streptosporangiaceae bacterium]